MTFLTWDNKADADTSLAAVNAAYGCEYTESNSYIMSMWDTVTKSNAEERWGFVKPEALLGKTEEQLISGLVAGYTEEDSIPSDWLPVVQ